MKFRSPLHKFINSLMIVLTLVWPVLQPMHLTAADFYWDADLTDTGNLVSGNGLGGNGTWDTAALNWWPVPAGPDVAYGNGANDRAIFTGPAGLSSSIVNVATVQANNLTFQRSGYLLSGGSINLSGTTPSVYVNQGEFATINSQLTGSAGLVKLGSGALRLGNSSNTYTGPTLISGGSVVISNAAALGTDSSPIVVSGSAARGFAAGALVLEGSYGTSGVTIARNLSLQGLGPGTDRTGALSSVRDNTVSGPITIGTPIVNTRINSSGGLLTMSGGVNVPGTAGTNLLVMGSSTNSAGVGGFAITGPLSGSGTLEKHGSGTLILAPSDTTGFSGVLRMSSSATGTSSSVRIATANALGTRTLNTTASVLDFNGGNLEVRMDSPFVLAGNASANVYHRAGTSALFVDHSVGGSAINQTLTLGQYAFEENLTFNFNGRNGYGVTFSAAPVQGGTGNSTINNNMNGNLTFTGNFWSNTDATGNRTLTIGGAGTTVLAGNLNATNASGNHSFTKTGTGTVAITSVAGTIDGAINVDQGTLAITDFRSLNYLANFSGSPANATINLGSGATPATLIIGTSAVASTAAGLTTGNRTINLAGTTGGVVINANQALASPVQINSTISSSGLGNKTLTLGGTSTQSNVVNGVISDNIAVNGVTSVTKADAGTWVLAGTNTYTGNTTVTAGTLEIRASAGASNIVPNANAVVFDTNPATLTAGGILQFRGVANTTTLETLGNLTANNGAGTVRIIGTGTGASSLQFSSVAPAGKGSGLNFDTSTGLNGTILLNGVPATTATTLPGNGHFYINGANFARVDSAGTVLVPVYGNDTGFVNANATTFLIGGNHNLGTANIAAQPDVSVTSLKMTANTLDLAGLLTVNTGAATNDGGILVTGNSTISGAGGITTGGSGTLVYRADVAASALFLNSTMTSQTTGGFTKNGVGSLVLLAPNAQTGDITINEGIVRLSGNGTLGAANSPLTVRQAGTLDIGGVDTGAAIGSFNGAGTISNTGANATITVGNGNGGGVFTGLIRDGAGNTSITNVTSITKVGTGAQTWSGNNSYTGVTTIGSSGLVSITNLGNYTVNSSIGRGNATSNAASLVFNGSTGGLLYIGQNSTLTDRLFTLNGNGTNAGGQISNSSGNQSAVVFSNTGAIEFGANATVPQTLTLGGTSTGDNVFSPQIKDNGALPTGINKINAGQWILGGLNNTYTGNTSIGQGILIARDGQGLSNNSALLIGSGTSNGLLQSAGNFTRNVSATPGPNTVTWNGSTGGGGFAASDGKLVVALGGLASPTPLTWGANGFVGTNNSTQVLLLNSATALAEVEIRNGINLGGETRTIQVDDNANTATDFATITGAISGSLGGNLTKTGGGILQLFGDSSYVGNTNVTGGTLTVSSLGNSALVGNSNLGANAGANTAAQALTLGNGTNTGGVLEYVGKGEISDRYIRLNTTTGANQIHANGSGPLILTNVLNDLALGVNSSKTLFLRGSNSMGNMITSNLADGLPGNSTLGITVDGGATWILTGNNTYSGVTTVSAGALGIGSPSSIGTGNLTLSNGNIFAHGGDVAVTNPVQLVNNTTNVTTGDNNLTIVNPLQNLATANNNVLTNGISAGKMLILNNLTSDAITDNRTFTINGTGDTVINGNITTSTPFNLNLAYSGNGSLTLGGTASVLNNGTFTVSAGTVKLAASEVIPDSTFVNNVVINPAANVTARLDLSGFNETINGLTATSAGITVIDNTAAATNSTLAIGGSNQNSNIGGTFGANYTIQNSGAGSTLNLTKIGLGNATINPGVALKYTGGTSVTGGGALTLLSPLNGTTSLNVSGVNSTLSISAGFTDPGTVKSISVGDGSTLSLIDGTGTTLGNLTSLTLGSNGGTNTNLNFNVGDLNVAGDQLRTDKLSLLAGGTYERFFGNSITLTVTDSGMSANQAYELLNSDGGLFTASDFVLGPVGGFVNSSLSTSNANKIILTVGNFVALPTYFSGTTDNKWNSNVNNWADDKGATTAATVIPGRGTDVIFNADSITGTTLNTTLEQNFLINSLRFEAGSSSTPTSVLIAPGVNLSNRLEIAPSSAALGIDVSSGAPGSVTISAPVRVSNDQTWNVSDATSRLILSSGVQGAGFDIAKTGAGKVTLSAAADNVFNLANTADVTVNGGTLEVLNTGALGSTNNSNLARIAVNNGGVFYYNNATSGTVANNLTLNGGTLSAGGNGQTYSGTINLAGNSSVVQRDQNSVLVNATARAITLSGVISGPGRMTIDGNTTLSNGNPIGPNLTIGGNNTNWTGGIEMLRGTVIATTPNGLGTGEHLFSGVAGVLTGNATIGGGRIILRGVDGDISNYENGLNFNSSTIGEYQVDNVGALASDFVVNQNATVNLGTFGGNGSGAIARFNMQDAASSLNLNGGIRLNGNSSLTATGGDADSLLTIAGPGITEAGDSYRLAINDEAGVWAVTSSRVAINSAGNYTGGTTLNEGTLILGNKNALGTGAFTITGASTLQGSVDLSAAGTGAFPNAVVLGNNLTVSGNNAITFANSVTLTPATRTLTNSIATNATLTLDGPVYLSTNALNGNLTLAGTAPTVINGNIQDSNGTGATLGNFTVTNSNLTTINGTNTYSGTTVMNAAAGILLLNGSNSSAGNTTLTNGRIQFNNAANGGLASGQLTLTAGTLEPLNNPLSLTNNSTVGGAINVNGTQNLTFLGNMTQTGGNRQFTNNLTNNSTLLLTTMNLSDSGTNRTLTIAGNGTTVINTLINNNANSTLTNSVGTGGGSLTVDKNVFLSDNSAIGRTLTIAGAGNTTVSGVIADFNGPGAAGNLTITNTGVTTFTGNNTYSGVTTMNAAAGRLLLQGSNSSAGNTTLTTGILQLDNASNGGLASGNLTLTAGTITPMSTARSISNETFLTAVTINGSQNLTMNGNLTNNAGNRTLTNNLDPGSTLTIAGSVNLTENSTVSRTLTFAGNGTTIVTGVIRNEVGGAGNASNLSKTGSGTLALNNSNTYTGTTTLNAGSGVAVGVIAANANNALGTGNATIVANGNALSSQLQLSGNITLNNNVVSTSGLGTNGVANGNITGIIRSVSGSNTIQGNISLIGGGGDSTYRADAGAALNFNGVIGGAANATRGINLVGEGNFDFNNVIRDSNNVPVLANDTVNFNSGTSGTTTLAAANTYTGPTTVTAGILRTTLNNALPSTTALTVNAGNSTATLDLNGNSNTIRSLTFGGANGDTGSVNVVNTGAGTLTLNGNVAVIATGNFTTAPQINGKLNLGVNPTVFNVADSTGSAVDLNVNAEVGGTAGMTKMGNGTMTLTGSTPNINSGVTTVTEGTLILGKSPNVNAIAGLGLALNKTTPDIVVNGGNLILAASEQINDGVFIRVTSGSLNFNNKNETIYNLEVSGGDVNYGTGDILIEDPVWSGGTNNIVGPTTFGFLEISGGNNTVSGTGTGGAGTLTIGTASVQGPLRFNGDNNAPTLVLNSDNATAGTLKFRPGSTIDLEFTGNGTSAGLISSAGSGTNAGQVDLNGSTRNFIIGDATGSAFDMTIAAKIIDSAGSSGINKTGAGTLVVSGANTYAGPTAVNAGTLVIDGSTAAGAVTVASGATLAGNGVVGGLTTISTGAILSPGDVVTKVGVLDFSSNLALGSGSTFTWELLSNTDAPGARGLAGTGFDGVDVAGGLSIDAAANSLLDFENTLLDWSDPFWLTDHQWTVFQGTTPYGGSLFAAINSTLKDGQGDLIGSVPNTGVFSWGTSANSVVLNYTAVPEPSSILLTVLGLLGVGMRRSRKTPKPSKVG